MADAAPAEVRTPEDGSVHGGEQGIRDEEKEESTEEHLLRYNGDYQHVLAACTVLENQLKRCKHDIEVLRQLKRRALEEPARYVENLRNKTAEKAPVAQRVVGIPDVDLSKYNPRFPSNKVALLQMRFLAAPMYKSHTPMPIEGQIFAPVESSTAEPEASNQEANAEADKIPSYKVPWTEDEQRQLEELLVVFSDETVQMKKFEKIANAMGTRSAAQVSSRVQKYFAKLEQAGLPVLRHKPPTSPSSASNFPIVHPAPEVTSPNHDFSRWSGARYARTILPEMDDAARGTAIPLEEDEHRGQLGLQTEKDAICSPSSTSPGNASTVLRTPKSVSATTATTKRILRAAPITHSIASNASRYQIYVIRMKTTQKPSFQLMPRI